MAQEYVVVEEQHAARHHPRQRSGTRPSGARIAAISATVVIALGVGAMIAWPESQAAPLPELEPEPRVASAAITTAAVFQEWEDRTVLIECLRDRGFPYEVQIVDQARSLPVVAQFLEIEPATANPDAPVPTLRQPSLYLGSGYNTVAEHLRGEATCVLPRTVVDTTDLAAVQASVAAARADGAFLAAVAEQVWVQQHPAEVTHRMSLLRPDHSSAAIDEGTSTWTAALEVVAGVAQDSSVWVPVVSGGNDSFAQSVGLASSGGAIAVRVGEYDMALNRGTYLSGAEVIQCGPVTISAGYEHPWGGGDDLAAVMHALGPACNALIREGIVEGESLADVYWD